MEKFIASLQRQKQFPLRSQGSSMLPILHPNDVVQYKKVNFKQLHTNDIILVKKNRRLFTHRIIYMTDKYLVTKGDNNPESDGKIYSHQIIGKVTKVKRGGKEFDPNQVYLLQSSLYFQEIIRIKSLLEKSGKIDFVFLKGLPLHLYFEKTHPKRIYADCDVLVDKKDFFKAEQILLKNGYKKAENHWSQTIKKMQERIIEETYYKELNEFLVVFDIHLEVDLLIVHLGKLEALYPQKLIDQLSGEFLKTKKVVKINGESFFILNSKFLILYLSLHFFHHNFLGVFRLDFLDKVIKKSHLKEKDWLEIAEKINQYKLLNFVSPVFLLLKKYYLTPIPDFINFKNFTNFKNLNIFDDEPRIGAGIKRFKNIFFLSPYPWWRKIFVFTNLEVIYTIIWIVFKRLSSFFSGRQ